MQPYAKYYPPDPEGGTAMVEFVIVFPMWLLMTLGIMQMALMHAASNVVQVSAFAAGRAAIVSRDTDMVEKDKDVDPTKAAKLINTPITGNTTVGGVTVPTVNSPGDMNGIFDYMLGIATRELAQIGPVSKTRLKFYESLNDSGQPEQEKELKDLKDKIGVHCQFDFQLLMPVVNKVFVWFYSIGGPKGQMLSLDARSVMSTLSSDSWQRTVFVYGNNPHAVISEKAILYGKWRENDDYKEDPNEAEE